MMVSAEAQWTLSHEVEISYPCNGDVCDRINGEHHCGTYTKSVYLGYGVNKGERRVEWWPEEPPM